MAIKRKINADAQALFNALETIGVAKRMGSVLKMEGQLEKIEEISLEDAVSRYCISLSKLSRSIKAYIYTIKAFVRSVEVWINLQRIL